MIAIFPGIFHQSEAWYLGRTLEESLLCSDDGMYHLFFVLHTEYIYAPEAL